MSWFGKKKKKEAAEASASAGNVKTETPASETEPSEQKSEQKPEPSPESVSEQRPEPESEDKSEPEKTSGGFFNRLKKGLTKTRDVLTTDIDDLFLGKKALDDDLLEEIEELLITSDMGVQTTMSLMEKIEKRASRITGGNALKAVLKEEISRLMESAPAETEADAPSPKVIMVVGVNGVGKTTSIGKLASRFSEEGKKVVIAAADTFRAAAVEQLTIWSERAGADIIRHRENADPAAVAFDSVQSAVARDKDIVLIDTAGRLHTKVNLMEELKKIRRAVAKVMPDAPHEVWLVLDATTGQNALSQARLFDESVGVTGLVLTKLDGTAKGGVVVSICDSLKIPINYIGIGEGVEDLQPFHPTQFAEALFH